MTIEKGAVAIDENKIAAEGKFDRIYVLRTNTETFAIEAALAYKGLWQVEQAFREIQSTFDIWPIRHSREDRIKGHFVDCFLAFCLQAAHLRVVREA